MYISSHWLARRIGTEFGESNKCYFDRSVEGHQRKSNWRNDAIALRTLEKFHKGLKNRILLFCKSAFLKYLTIFTVKNIWWSPFSVMVQSASLVKKNSFTSVLSDCLKKNKQVIANANELCSELHRMATSDSDWYSKEQQVATSGTMNDNKWQRMTTSENEWQRVVQRLTKSNPLVSMWSSVCSQNVPQNFVPESLFKKLCRLVTLSIRVVFQWLFGY